MKKALLVSVLSCFLISPALAEEHSSQSWGYIGSGAPHKWGELGAGFEVCKSGTEQSPVNIDRFMQEGVPALNMAYSAVPLVVANTGYTVQVNVAPGTGFRANDTNFNLLNFQFRTPSEHYVDGAPYPMEAQFFHKAADGAVSIVSVMFKVGAHNPLIEGIWQNVPQVGSSKDVSGVEINPSDLMPEDKSFFIYQGSLTAPPCTEGVTWYVMQEPIELSAQQLKAFQAVFPINARPIQDLGERTIKGN